MKKSSVTNKPLIGITSVCSSRNVKLDNAYAEAVFQAGGIAVILPQADSEERAQELVQALDGIVFSGGEDLAPELYGEDRTPEAGKSNVRRDKSDLLLIKAALKDHKAILGICRGAQAVNVALGGSLYQDIGSGHKKGKHPVEICNGSVFRQIIGEDSIVTNSLHHQAIKQLGRGLRLSATAADGIIEAYEGLPEINVIGTQFHPEKLAVRNSGLFRKLFDNLVERSK